MKIQGPTNPYHIARAYNVPTLTRPARPPSPATVHEIKPPVSPRLIAASVPGRVDFSPGAPSPVDAAAIPMYRHPADRNAAATAVNAGRVIDLRA